MSLPKELIELIQEINKANPIPDEAFIVAQERVKNSSLYTDELKEALIDLAIRELIYRNRCVFNKTLKREVLSSDPKLKPLSDSVMGAASSFYDLYVGSNRLGSILGKQLLPLAADERATAEGHIDNAQFFESIATRYKIPPEGRVEDYVKEIELRRLYTKLIKGKAKQAV